MRTQEENIVCFETRLKELVNDFNLPQSLQDDLIETLKCWIKI